MAKKKQFMCLQIKYKKCGQLTNLQLNKYMFEFTIKFEGIQKDLHWNYPFEKLVDHAHEHLIAENFFQVQNENSQPPY